MTNPLKSAGPNDWTIEETNRLQIVATPPDLLTALVDEDVATFERTFNVVYRGERLDDEFKKIVASAASAIAENDDDYRWRTFWFLIRRSDRVAVGSFDFKGAPNVNGDVEIGYGLGKAFEGNGYMTEAVAAMTRRAFETSNGPRRIVAETDVANEKSRRVLERCGFRRVATDGGPYVRWVLDARSFVFSVSSPHNLR